MYPFLERGGKLVGKYDGSLRYDTSLNLDGFKKGIANLKNLAKTGVVTVGAVSAAIGALEVAGVKYNAQIENYETSFKVMTGSAEKAKETIETLRKMGAETPFELTDLAETTQLLMNYSFTADEAIDRMSMLGDISQGNADKLNRVAMAYGQMSSANKVALEDVKQMIEAGFNPLQEISQTTGESMASLYDRISKGAISVDEITASMQRSTSEGGKYFQSMAEQSKTTSGQISTMKDNWDSFTGAIAKSASNALKDSVLPKLNEALEESIDMVEGGALDEINGLVDSLGSFVADTIPKLVSGTKSILDNAVLIESAIVGIGGAMVAHKATMLAFVAVEKWNAAKTVVNAYSAALVANQTTAWAGATAHTLLASTMSTTQLVVGVLTGKISLATAATATWNKAVTLLKGTAGIAGLIAIMAGAVATFITWQRNIETTDNSLKKLREEHEQNLKAIDENCNAQKAEAEQVALLADRVVRLSDEYKSYAKDSAQAIEKSKELKIAADNLAEIVPQISSALYDETGEINIQSGAVQQLAADYIKLAQAKAMAEALSDKMKETAARIIDVQSKYDELNQGGKDGIYADDRNWAEKLIGRWKSTNILSQSRKLENEINSLQTEWEGYAQKASEANDIVSQLTEQFTKETKDEADERRNAVTSTTRQATQEISKEFEKQYKNLKRSLERDEITHAEYYKDLKKLRDTYFTEGSDGWEKYTEELADFTEDTFDDCLDTLDDFKNESLDKINELKDEQESLKEKLITDKAPIEWGTIDGESFVSLANYDKEINQMQRYGNMLDELFSKRGNLPQSVLDEIKEMDTEQAMRYMQALLNSSDSQFDAFIKARQKLEEEASKNSAKVMSAEAEEMKRILEEKFGELPEDFFKLGDESATAFGEAFLNELQSAMEVVRSTIMAEMSSVTSAFSFAGAGGVGSSMVNSNNTTSYNFYSSRETTTQQLTAANNAATLSRLRGGN